MGGAAGILFLTLYILMIGFTVSAVRAFVMFLFRVGADIAGRHYDSPTALMSAVVIVLLWRPLSVFDGGFWLSFGAVASVIFLLPLFEKLPIQGLWASVSINLILFPVILYYFYEFPAYSSVLNLFIIPLMSVLLFLGITGSVLCALPVLEIAASFMGACLLKICSLILWIYEKSCTLMLGLPGARVVAGKPLLWQMGVYYLCLGAAVLIFHTVKKYFFEEAEKESTAAQMHMPVYPPGSLLRGKKERQNRIFRYAVYAVCLLCIGCLVLLYRFGENGKLTVAVLDVGQGDGIFIRGPSGVTYLIDGGSSDVKSVGKYRIEPFLKSQGVKRLDYVFISHGDSDHISGIREMMERSEVGVEIGNLILPIETVWDDAIKELAAEAVKRKVKTAVIEPGQKLVEEELCVSCLQPGTDYKGETGNAASLILAVSYKGFDMLLTGDVEKEGEQYLTEMLARDYKSTGWEVLKTAHHGSKNSSSEKFLKEVNPQYAVISAGKKNRYGHPHEETLEKLEALGSRIYSTKESGAVMITVDEKRMEITGFCTEK